MVTKTFLVLFSNAFLIFELMLCNRNFTKLVYQTLLSSNCRAWALKLSEHLKKSTKFLIKIRLKRAIIRQLKITINQCKKNSWGKKTFLCNNVLLYTVNNISMVLQIIIIKFSCIWKQCPEILFLILNLTVLHIHIKTALQFAKHHK